MSYVTCPTPGPPIGISHGSNRVWTQDGSGTFVDTGSTLGNSQSQGVALGDVDGDGDLDAFVVNGINLGQANRVWINDGSAVFSDSGNSLGSTFTRGVALGDMGRVYRTEQDTLHRSHAKSGHKGAEGDRCVALGERKRPRLLRRQL